MKKNRLITRLLVIIAIFGAAMLAWKLGLVPMAKPKCEPLRMEQSDASGKVVKITTRTCP